MTQLHVRARPARRAPRAGFTLVEMMVSMTMLLALIGAAMSLYQGQTKSMTRTARRLDALSNAQYALTAIERELRVAGAGTVAGQPVLVAATSRSIVFSANVATRDSLDAQAVYVNLDADPAAVGAFRLADRAPVPGNPSDYYPDTTHVDGGGAPTRAETIAFWFSPDSTATDPTEHILWRRANRAAPEVVARGILIAPTDTVFQFFQPDDKTGLKPIDAAKLPLAHSAYNHGNDKDKDAAALIDSVRLVRLRVRAVMRSAGNPPTVRRTEGVVRIQNAGMLRRETCGEKPLPTSPTASVVITGGVPTVEVAWNAAVDEIGGENDVERYVIYRRATGTPDFEEPIASVPAGQPSYKFVDSNVLKGQIWVYGVAAQDCSPANSEIFVTSAVAIP